MFANFLKRPLPHFEKCVYNPGRSQILVSLISLLDSVTEKLVLLCLEENRQLVTSNSLFIRPFGRFATFPNHKQRCVIRFCDAVPLCVEKVFYANWQTVRGRVNEKNRRMGRRREFSSILISVSKSLPSSHPVFVFVPLLFLLSLLPTLRSSCPLSQRNENW